MNSKPRRTYTPAQVAEALQLHIRTIYRMIHKGQIRAISYGSAWRIPDVELDRLLDPTGEDQ